MMHFSSRTFFEIALVLVGVTRGLAAQSIPANDIALTGVTLIDGTGAPPRPGVTIVIARGRIARIQADSVSIPVGTRRQNLGGRFVIPGLIDAHVHLGTQPRPPGVMEQILRACFLGGVTGVRDMGGQFEIVSHHANLGNTDSIPMPRVVYSAIVAGPGMWLEGERAQFFAGGSTPGNSPTVRRLVRHDDVAAAVASAKRAGASAIKIYNTVSPTLLNEVAAEAHRRGLHVWSHLFVDPNAPSAVIDAGAEVVSHADMFVAELLPRPVREGSIAGYRAARREVLAREAVAASPAITALLSKMKQRHVILDPTLFIMRPGPDSAGRVDRAHASLFHAAVEFTRAAHRAGVDVDAGTDALGGSAPNIHVELQLLVDSVGMTTLQAIRAATQVGARAMGLGDSVGTIEVGKRADLVVLSADPSRDIANTMSVVGVMKAGIYHERTRPLTPPPGARRPLPQ